MAVAAAAVIPAYLSTMVVVVVAAVPDADVAAVDENDVVGNCYCSKTGEIEGCRYITPQINYNLDQSDFLQCSHLVGLWLHHHWKDYLFCHELLKVHREMFSLLSKRKSIVLTKPLVTVVDKPIK